jgi:long-chain fatty acid transport protein
MVIILKISYSAFTSITVVLLSLALQQRDCLAGGFMIPHQTARALGLSNAQTAGVQDASAVYYNPAALSEVEGNNLLLSGTYVNLQNSVENGGRRSVNRHDDNLLATVFGNYHIPGSDVTLGVGIYSPFGLATTYEKGFIRFAAERTELKIIYVTPAIAWHLSRYFSAGAGFSFVHASGLFSRGLCLTPPGVSDPLTGVTGCSVAGGLFEGRLRLTDTANAFTYNLGLLVKPINELKFGLSYRARADLRFDNSDIKFGGVFAPANTKGNVRPIPLPPVVNAGVLWQINLRWGIEFVYEYTRWSEFKSISANFLPTPLFLGALPVPGFTLPEDWKDTSTLRLGISYALNKNWELRGGIAVEDTPIPSRTLNPAIPDADKLTLNAGVGYKWDKFSLDLGYMAGFYKTRKVRNNELEGLPATGIPFTGAGFLVGAKDTYKTFVNFVTVSLGYHF